MIVTGSSVRPPGCLPHKPRAAAMRWLAGRLGRRSLRPALAADPSDQTGNGTPQWHPAPSTSAHSASRGMHHARHMNFSSLLPPTRPGPIRLAGGLWSPAWRELSSPSMLGAARPRAASAAAAVQWSRCSLRRNLAAAEPTGTRCARTPSHREAACWPGCVKPTSSAHGSVPALPAGWILQRLPPRGGHVGAGAGGQSSPLPPG